MPKAIRKDSDQSTGHDDYFPPRAPDEGNSSQVYANGILIAVVGNHYPDHIDETEDEDEEPNIHDGVASGGSPNVFINNTPIHRANDPISCGDTAANGSPNVFINGE